MTDLVLFYYRWKKSDRYIPIYSKYCKETDLIKILQKSRAVVATKIEGNSDDETKISPCVMIKMNSQKMSFVFSQQLKKNGILDLSNVRGILICFHALSIFLKYARKRPNLELLQKLNLETDLVSSKDKKNRRKLTTPIRFQFMYK
jgi:endogenous inhibitor of DNA gyrase (YacG/DUF329 family)